MSDAAPRTFTAPMRYWEALEKGELLDLTVHLDSPAGPRESVRVHRLVLSTSCPYLHHSVIDAVRNSARPEITLPQFTKEEFHPILRFIYTELTDGFTNASLMCVGLYAAKLFHMENLADYCLGLLHRRFEEDEFNTALQVLEKRKLIAQHTELIDEIELYFSQHTLEILQSATIAQMSFDTMDALLDVPVSEEVDEVVYFRAVHDWTVGRSRKQNMKADELRDHTQRLLRKIRRVSVCSGAIVSF